jgi:hypothetical protein
MTEPNESKYAIFCEATGYDRPLLMHDRTFAQLIDELVVPFEQGHAFFVDGAPLTRDKVIKLKILAQHDVFPRLFADLHWGMRFHSDVKLKEILASQYHVRFEALLREGTTDVTSQVISAFTTEIKPRLRDYLPNRKELIDAALRVFTESIRVLGTGS